MNNIISTQQAIIYSILHKEIDLYLFSDIIPDTLFGNYQKIFLYIKENGVDSWFNKTGLDLNISAFWEEIVFSVMRPTFITSSPAENIIYLFENEMKELSAISDTFNIDTIIQRNVNIIDLKKRLAWYIDNKYSINNIYNDIYQEWLLIKENNWPIGYTTGLNLLDDVCWWLRKKTVTRLNAYANTGKSKVSYHVCNAVLSQELKTIYFTLEVSSSMVLQNLIMNSCNLEYSEVASGKWIDRSQSQVKSYANKISPLLEIVDNKYTLSDIITHCKVKKPDVVFIDFVQLIRTDDKEEYARMTRVAEDIQIMAKELDIAVFDLSQVSNDGASKAITERIYSKWSWALAASADIVVTIERKVNESYTNWDEKLIMHVQKNKFWRNGIQIEIRTTFSRWQIKCESFVLAEVNIHAVAKSNAKVK